MTLPPKALSIRQPWAWAIVYGGKTLENRSWGSWNHHLKKFRGDFCIHASTGMTRDEYESAKDFMVHRCKVECPPPDQLVRGAIIGTARVINWIKTSQNPWWMGPGALVLDHVKPLAEPISCSGALGWFDWKPEPNREIEKPAKWMLPKADVVEGNRQESLL